MIYYTFASFSKEFCPSVETAGSASVSGGALSVTAGAPGAFAGIVSAMVSATGAEAAEVGAAGVVSALGTEVDKAAGFDAADLDAASTLRLTCFSLTIATRFGPKSAEPSIFEKRVLTYSISRSKL